jgi:anti-sigma factor RsiW
MKMTMCDTYRNEIVLRPDVPDLEREAHVANCPLCSKAASRVAAFDTVLRSTLNAAVPDDLTARLLALVPGLVQPMVRSKRWIRQRRALLIGGGILGLAALTALMYGLYMLGVYLGIGDALATVGTWPGIALDWLYHQVPSSRQIMATLITLRQPMQWAIFAALIWLAWERVPARSGVEQQLAG